MRSGNIFFHIVINEVTVRLCEIGTCLVIAPENVFEDLKLEREIKQVVVVAILTEKVGTFLRIGIDTALGRVTEPGGI